jgi:hypothetical protein
MAPVNEKLLRRPTPQPNMKPVKPPPSTKRGGGYEGPRTTPRGWIWGGDATQKPNFDPGFKGQQQKLRKRWFYT